MVAQTEIARHWERLWEKASGVKPLLQGPEKSYGPVRKADAARAKRTIDGRLNCKARFEGVGGIVNAAAGLPPIVSDRLDVVDRRELGSRTPNGSGVKPLLQGPEKSYGPVRKAVAMKESRTHRLRLLLQSCRCGRHRECGSRAAADRER